MHMFGAKHVGGVCGWVWRGGRKGRERVNEEEVEEGMGREGWFAFVGGEGFSASFPHHQTS